jgi:uncharacterized protein (TIGR02246 family)
MTSMRAKVAAAVLLVVLFPMAAVRAMPADSHDADSAAVNKLFTDFNNAFNNHDAHAVSMLFTGDADYTTTGGATSKGTAEIEKHLQPLFAGRLKSVHREVTLRGIRFLDSGVATLISDYVVTGLMGPNGSEVPPAKGLYDWIVMKQSDGRWLITAWHEANLPPPPPPAPAQ